MARHPFGGTIADYAVTDGGGGAVNFAAGVTVLFYTAVTAGTQITDLATDATGATPVTGTTTGTGSTAGEVIEVWGPDGVLGMWASANGGPRVFMLARDAADMIAANTAGLATLSGTVSAHTTAVNPHGTAFPDLVDTDATARANGYIIVYDSATGKNKYVAPSSASGAVLLNPPLVGGVSVAQQVTPPTGTGSGDPWLDTRLPYSASDNNPDFLQIHAYWSDLVTRIKTYWNNGNGEVRGAPSTPGRIGARFFESYESIGLSTGRFFELSTNPTNTANREPLLGAYGSASSTKPGWIEATRILSALQGVAVGGNYNSLTQFIFRGKQATTGAPTSGTWLAGDVVMDSVGVLYLCTVGGTSGTWVGGGNYTTLTDVASLGTNVSHGTPHFQSRTEPGGITRLQGQLSFTGSITGSSTPGSGATLATLPAGQRPAGFVTFTERFLGTGAAAAVFFIDTSGNLSCSANLVSGNTVNLDGVTFIHA